MADIELIVKMSEEQYKFIKEGVSINIVAAYPALMDDICRHIANGTPLPKHHSDLIERDELLKQPMDLANYPSNYVRNAKTIIPATNNTKVLAVGGNGIGKRVIEEMVKQTATKEKGCETCIHQDDDPMSGECYECVKRIMDHYEPATKEGESE